MLKPGDVVKLGVRQDSGIEYDVLFLWHTCYVDGPGPDDNNPKSAVMRSGDVGLVLAQQFNEQRSNSQILVLVNGQLGWVWSNMMRNAC